ncbi:MAG: transcriptional regulator [Flavobacteriaceae bacterium]|nr:transcriptional regulator [Flavobacteriaceae bacterium]|tara:strand:- start:1689 stop:2234 length:546 start_codon:yes stop_codon:yes gene_type:complete
MIIKPGDLLISTPNVMGDVNFHRSVIIITECTENSVMGFMLNKRIKYLLNEIVNDIKFSFPVYYGGPVESNNLFYLFNSKVKIGGSEIISKNLFCGGNFKELINNINENKIDSKEIKFFLGYSGWSINQLENEIDEKSWEIVSNNDDIFSFDEKNIWRNSLKSIGNKYLLWINSPENPINN